MIISRSVGLLGAYRLACCRGVESWAIEGSLIVECWASKSACWSSSVAWASKSSLRPGANSWYIGMLLILEIARHFSRPQLV